ncbi:hypothetical protein RIF29_26538 [Crotalaria pallida]|uniref:Uncharacterized protein n=1 Tax=Crotalaria pallida TaxID=3830 RepID=A0AAN9I1R9_CROPI
MRKKKYEEEGMSELLVQQPNDNSERDSTVTMTHHSGTEFFMPSSFVIDFMHVYDPVHYHMALGGTWCKKGKSFYYKGDCSVINGLTTTSHDMINVIHRRVQMVTFSRSPLHLILSENEHSST